jgi:hypothetical protein
MLSECQHARGRGSAPQRRSTTAAAAKALLFCVWHHGVSARVGTGAGDGRDTVLPAGLPLDTSDIGTVVVVDNVAVQGDITDLTDTTGTSDGSADDIGTVVVVDNVAVQGDITDTTGVASLVQSFTDGLALGNGPGMAVASSFWLE